MFADDTKIWKKLNQNKIMSRCRKTWIHCKIGLTEWLLKSNAEKCKIMQVGHKLNTKYHIGISGTRIKLEIIEEEKDLGVFIRSDLKSGIQCLKSAAKAREE